MVIKIVALVVLIIFSAYFSATETAFSSINLTRIKLLAEKGDKKAKKVLKLSENYNNLISTILIGNNIVNIAAASIGTIIFVKLYGDIGATVSTAVLTLVVLIFGEISPKSIAKDTPEKFAMFSAPFIGFLVAVLSPINFIFNLWKRMLSKIFKLEDNKKMSQEELIMLVNEVQEEGSIDNNEGNMLRNVIEFSEQRAEDILTHRGDMAAVNINDDKKEIAKVFAESKFSRLPVYDESTDDIVGILNLKDFYTETGITTKKISKIITEPVFVQKSLPVDKLLKTLQAEKSHIAIVVDEYGGTVGIVTMEDILEEIVGEIWDEHDDIVEDFQKVSENEFLVDGLLSFEDFCDFFELENTAESISVGGWIMEELGKIAEVGDSFSYDNLDITVSEVDGRRVSKIKVIQNEKPKEEPEEE